nr:hypothetical protein CFP56_04283 [Quercus suber]
MYHCTIRLHDTDRTQKAAVHDWYEACRSSSTIGKYAPSAWLCIPSRVLIMPIRQEKTKGYCIGNSLFDDRVGELPLLG